MVEDATVKELEKEFEYYYKLMSQNTSSSHAASRAILTGLGLIAAKAEYSLDLVSKEGNQEKPNAHKAMLNLIHSLEDCGKISALLGVKLLNEQPDNESKKIEEDTSVS